MPYTPTTWVEGAAPGISAINLNNLETQYDQAVADAALAIRRKIVPPTVRWSAPGWWWNNDTAQAPTANRTYYMPIYVPVATTYIRIGINVSGGDGGGGTADLRIFEWASGVPGDLILSAGTVNTNGAALK